MISLYKLKWNSLIIKIILKTNLGIFENVNLLNFSTLINGLYSNSFAKVNFQIDLDSLGKILNINIFIHCTDEFVLSIEGPSALGVLDTLED